MTHSVTDNLESRDASASKNAFRTISGPAERIGAKKELAGRSL